MNDFQEMKVRFLNRLPDRSPRGRLRLFQLVLIILGVLVVLGILRHSVAETQQYQEDVSDYEQTTSPLHEEDPYLKFASSSSPPPPPSPPALDGLPTASKAPAQSEPTSAADAPWMGWHAIENIFVFGDSYTDNGFWAMGYQPNDTHYYGNYDRLPHGGIFTPRWPNFLATTYNETFIRVWNYAWTGSTIDKKVVSAWALSQDFPTQVGLMLEAMDKPEVDFHPWTAKDSLVAIFLGVNDVNLSADDEKEGPVKDSMAAFRANMDKLYDRGARNFLILNTPPIDVAMQKHMDLVPQGLATYNEAFKELQQDYVRNKPGATVFLFDTNSLMKDILEDAKRFPETSEVEDTGLFLPTCMSCEFAPEGVNTTDAACAMDSRKHFWCEWMHIGFPVQNATAANIVKDCFSSNRRTGYCS